jgi:hypothetical protein
LRARVGVVETPIRALFAFTGRDGCDGLDASVLEP